MSKLLYLRNILFIGLAISLSFSVAVTNFFWLSLFLITLVLFIKKPDFSIFKDKIHYPLYFFILVSIISIIFSVDFGTSVREFKKIGQVFILFMFIYNFRDLNMNKKFWKFLFFGAIASAIFGLLQYIIGINNYYGTVIVPSLWQWLPERIISLLELSDSRIQGTFGHYLTYSEVLMLTLTLSICIILQIKNKFLYLLFSLAIVIAIIFSYCRGVWISIFFFVILLFILESKFRNIFYKLIPILAIFVVIMAIFIPSERSIVSRFKSIKVNANTDRIKMWKSGIKITKDYPVFGIGPKCLPLVYPKYIMPGANKPNEGHLHSNFMQIMVDRGIIGVVAFCGMFLGYFIFFYIYYRKSKNEYIKYLSLGAFGVLLVFSISGLTEYSFGDSEVVMLFWAILGLSIAGIRSDNLQILEKTN